MINPVWTLQKKKELAKELGLENHRKVYKWHFEYQKSKWNNKNYQSSNN